MLERAVDMLAVAVQLPAPVLADEASGAAAIAIIAPIPLARALMLTMKPASLADERKERRQWVVAPV
jgi:hypothetical protein